MNDNKEKIENNLEYIKEDIELIEDESETTIKVNNIEEESIELLEVPVENTEVLSELIEVEIGDSNVISTEKKDIMNNEKNKKNNRYIDYKVRLVVHIGIFITLFVIAIIFLQNTFDLSSSTKVNYKENSNLDYKVYLKPNEFYEDEYLGKDKVYVASLIEKITIDFVYNFNIEKPSDVNFDYDVIGKLTINDSSSEKNYFEKEYVLLNKKTATIKDSTDYNLIEQIKIDYAHYNNLASNFKQQYGVETTSDFTVYLKVNKQNDIDEISNSNEDSTMLVKIPLSQKSIDIELNYKDINNSSYIIKTNESIIDNVIFGIFSLITIIIMIIIGVRLFHLLEMLKIKKSDYDKYIDKILNQYDRIIVENKTGPNLNECNIIKISEFEELIDVRDNMKLPIMYYIVTKHIKCYFYVKHENDLYLLTIKAIDIEQKNKNDNN